jgi:hypothetical protein
MALFQHVIAGSQTSVRYERRDVADVVPNETQPRQTGQPRHGTEAADLVIVPAKMLGPWHFQRSEKWRS